MTISEMGLWDKVGLFFRLIFKKERKYLPAGELLDMLNASGVKNIKISARGGVEVPIDELKNSPQFQSLQNHARLKIEKDSVPEK